jgi:vacuolar-type H+-ATPase subunit H
MMSVDILREITAAESQAEKTEADAAQAAREIITAARKDASDMKARLLQEAEEEAGSILKAFEEDARQQISELDMQIQAQCDDLAKNSGARLDKAVDFIVGRIVKS